jgi:hypothetical protein
MALGCIQDSKRAGDLCDAGLHLLFWLQPN